MKTIVFDDKLTDDELKILIYSVIRANQDRPKKKIIALIKEEIPEISINKIAELLLELSK